MMFNNYLELFQGYAELYSGSNQQNLSTINPSSMYHHRAGLEALKIQQQFQQDVTGNLVFGLPKLATKQIDNHEVGIVIGSFNRLKMIDLLCILAIFMNFIYARINLAKKLNQSIILKGLGLRSKDREKLIECIWRLLFYFCSSIWLAYTCFLKRKSHIYLKPYQVDSTEYTFNIDLDEYLIIMVEIGFYIHAIYAAIFEDIWRRDSPAVIIHHIAAAYTVTSFYATRTHRLGLTVVALRDTCDVLLEVAKLIKLLEIQHGKVVKSMDKILKVCIFVFTGCFIINQLYYYPLYCLFHGLNMVKLYNFRTQAAKSILTCGLIFLVLDLFWLLLIIRLLFRIIFSSRPLTDLREYDNESEEKELRKLMEKSYNIEKSNSLINKKVD